MNWQPIETAPKDRPLLLLVQMRKKHGRPSVFPLSGEWVNDHWVIFNADWAIQRVEPTHWQLLPPPFMTPEMALRKAIAA